MWFHVSKEYLGDNPMLIPKLPRKGNLKIIKCEGNIPRICVSNSLFCCLRAIHGVEELASTDIYFTENPCVYYTEETPYLPPDYYDFRVNNEMWFIKRTRFYYLARIDMYRLFAEKIITPTKEKDLILPSQKTVIKQARVCFLTKIFSDLSGGIS